MDDNIFSVVNGLVKTLAIPVTQTSIKKQIAQSPNLDNLLGLSDMLNKWGIDNAGYEIGADEITNDMCLFIAFVLGEYQVNEFILVTAINDESVVVTNQKHEKTTISRQAFTNIYQGFVLLVDPGEDAGEADYRKIRSQEIAESFRLPLLFFTGLLLLSTFFLKSSLSDWRLISIFLYKVTGLTISVLLLTKVISNNNTYLNRICKIGGNADCDSILFSKTAKVFSWLSWSEVGFFYFSSTTLLLIINPSPAIIQLMAYTNILCLPYVFYSIGYQGFIAKKWCVLCCAVQLCLVLEFSSFVHYVGKSWLSVSLFDSCEVVLAIMIPVSLWWFLRPIFIKSVQLPSVEKSLSKFKFNNDLFLKMLSEQPPYPIPSQSQSIVLGNPDPTRLITLVSNPYCTPCSRAHKDIDKLLEQNPDLQVRVILTDTNNQNDINKHLLALSKTNNADIKQALSDWYDSTKDYQKWSQRHPINGELTMGDTLLKNQQEWCEIAKVDLTPLVIINGYKLPENYKIEDLSYLI